MPGRLRRRRSGGAGVVAETLGTSSLPLLEGACVTVGFPDALSLRSDAEAEDYYGLGIVEQWRVLHRLLADRASSRGDVFQLLQDATNSFEPKLRFLVPGTASLLPELLTDQVLALNLSLAKEDDLRIAEAVQAFGLRPLAEREGPAIVDCLSSWVVHSSSRVRRAVVESLRPRGVWVKHLQWAVENPSFLLPILDVLQKDDSRLVCNSVGNSLNDVSKAKPELALEISRRWLDASERGEWTEHVVSKGLRTLVNHGDPRALMILGLENLRVEAKARLKGPRTVAPNSNLELELEIRSHGEEESKATLVCELETPGKNPLRPRRRRRRIGTLLLLPKDMCVFRVRERVYDKKSAPLLDGAGSVRFFLNGREEAEVSFELKRI